MSSELWLDVDGRITRLEVAPLRGDALREAIETPARDAGVYLESALIERVISDAAAEPEHCRCSRRRWCCCGGGAATGS